MPIYQYRCTACLTILECRQGFDEPCLTECPSCSGTLRRVLSPAGIIFKGSGWYCTDSRGKADSEKSTECQSCEKEPAGSGTKT